MALYTDDLNRTFAFKEVPQRIVSLVPSQTELLYHLGLEERVIGITKFCIHPQEWFKTKTRIGGTKNINLENIKSLQPDLILANKEENVQAQVEDLAQAFPVWVSDVNNLYGALRMIQAVGDITGTSQKAATLVVNIQKGFETFLPAKPFPTVVYLIWQEPYMSVGGDTFISHLLQQAGFINLLETEIRYPQLTSEDLQTLQPQYLFLSSEPYPFKTKHIKAFQSFLPHTKVVLVDGEIFSWYGSRLLHAPAYFTQLQQGLELV